MTHVLVARLDNAGDVLLAGPPCAPSPRARARDAAVRARRRRGRRGCCPASTRSWSRRARGSHPEPAAGRAATTSSASIDALAALARRRGADPHLVPPEPAAAGAAAAAGRRARHRRDLRGLPRLAARRPPPRARRRPRGRAGAVARARAGLRAARRRRRPPARAPPPAADPPATGYVVVHPGASVPARAWAPDAPRRAGRARWRGRGRRVVVTGAPGRARAHRVTSPATDALDLGGAHVARRAGGVLAGAACVVVGNTGPAHLAAAVGTPGRLAVRADRPGRALAPVAACRTCCCTATCPAPAAGPARARCPATRASTT